MGENKRILILEDDLSQIKSMKSSLEKEGYAVDTASDGLKGLNKAREGMPDLIIMNAMIPRIDGYHVCRFLKFDQKYMHIPIILVSTKAVESEKQKDFNVGADEYLYKPFDNDKLISTVHRYLF